ncbi:MAG: choice-of-anchor L domain-containing protein [Bacteroidia bacterium]|nr:choice-of-anchor L domain-containing protein [Bacteroidia bacterium]
MKNFLIIAVFIFCFLCKITEVRSQLVVNANQTPTQLANNIVWGGMTLANVSVTSPLNCAGTFQNGSSTNLGMSNGVIMSTGGIASVPNSNSYFISNSLGGAGDPLLDALSGGYTSYDATVLEFDFTPFTTPVNFRYIFGSEEYPEYVCSNFNDVFGFFVTGQKPSGGNYLNENVALIPGTTLPVMINSVNPGTPGSYGTTSGCTSLANSNYYVANSGSTICFDGFTTPINATVDVVPFTTYHMKFAVSDIGDGAYDSGVFLEAYSFFSNAVRLQAVNSSPGNNSIIESCGSGTFLFEIYNDATTNDTIRFTIDGTATNGVDYNYLPSYVVIPAGSSSATLTINPISDGLIEGSENVILRVWVSSYGTQDISFNISDNGIYNAAAVADKTICEGQSVLLTAWGGYSYLWNTTSTNDSIFVSPTNSTLYTVQISDSLGCSKTDTVNVTVLNPAIAGFGFSDNGQGVVTFNDQSLNGTSWYWDFGNGNYSFEQNPVFSYLSQGNYTVMQVVQNSCGSDTSYQTISVLLNVTNNYIASKIELFPNPNDGNFYIDYKSENNNDLLIQIINTSGKTVYYQNISNNNLSGNNPINMKNLSKGLYQLKISSSNDYDVVRFMVK